jgi:predicted SnoaL-like aldol condensation-catalyzing enzyme
VPLLLALTGMVMASALPTIPAVATDESAAIRDLRVQPPLSARVGTALEEVNKRIVLQWHYEFFDLGHFRRAAEKYLAPDFQQNDPDEKSGREAYVQEFEHSSYVPRKPAERPPLIAVLADGDLVMMVIPAAGGGPDPSKGFIHCNMFRLKNGRIIAMWVSADAAKPATPAMPAK